MFEPSLGDSDGQGSRACCSPWGHQESDTTEQLNNVTWKVGSPKMGHCIKFKLKSNIPLVMNLNAKVLPMILTLPAPALRGGQKAGHAWGEFLGEDVLDLTPALSKDRSSTFPAQRSTNQVCGLRDAKFPVEGHTQLGVVQAEDGSQESREEVGGCAG